MNYLLKEHIKPPQLLHTSFPSHLTFPIPQSQPHPTPINQTTVHTPSNGNTATILIKKRLPITSQLLTRTKQVTARADDTGQAELSFICEWRPENERVATSRWSDDNDTNHFYTAVLAAIGGEKRHFTSRVTYTPTLYDE